MGYWKKKRENQTNVHRHLVQASILWLSNRVSLRGIRGTTEWSPSHRGSYSADFLALGAFQYTHALRYEKKPSYDPKVMVFEAKAFRTDFMRMFGPKGSDRTTGPLGHLHWIVCPKDLVTPDEVPGFWGLLERRGGGLSEKKLPLLMEISESRATGIAADMLWARHSWMRNYECERLDRIVRFMRRHKVAQPAEEGKS